MAQIQSKFIANNAVTSTKIANGAVTDSKLGTGIDAAKLADGSVSNTELQYINSLTSNAQTQLDAKINNSEKGANNGVATLDAGGKVPVSQLPSSVMEFKGLFDPATATFTDAAGNAGDVYQASAAGSYDAGSGSITYAIGDWAVHNGSVFQKSLNSNSVASVNGQTGVVVLTTTNISEGTNLYYTDERAQDAIGNNLLDTASVDLSYNDGTGQISAAVLPAGVDHDQLLNYSASKHVDHSLVNINTAANSGMSGGGDISTSRSMVVDPTNAPAVTAASNDYILIADASDVNNLKKVTAQSIADLASTPLNSKQNFTLSAGDITNQYVDLSQVARNSSIIVSVSGIVQAEGSDYTVTYTGGVGGNTRITFAGDLATGGAAELVATDVLRVQYEY